MNITPITGPLADMLRSKKAIALALSLAVVGVLCYLGKVTTADLLAFAKWVVAAYLAAEGVAKIGSTESADTVAVRKEPDDSRESILRALQRDSEPPPRPTKGEP